MDNSYLDKSELAIIKALMGWYSNWHSSMSRLNALTHSNLSEANFSRALQTLTSDQLVLVHSPERLSLSAAGIMFYEMHISPD